LVCGAALSVRAAPLPPEPVCDSLGEPGAFWRAARLDLSALFDTARSGVFLVFDFTIALLRALLFDE
jgi:hypothetical protein